MPANRETNGHDTGKNNLFETAAQGARWLAERTVMVVTAPLEMSEERRTRGLRTEVKQENPARYAEEAEKALCEGQPALAKLTVELALHSLAEARDAPDIPGEVKAHLGERVMAVVEQVRPVLAEDEQFALPPLADGVEAGSVEDVVDEIVWDGMADLAYRPTT